MRPFLVVAFLLQIVSYLPAHSQNIDSISRAIDSTSLKLKEADNRFQNLEDSLYKQKMQRSLKEEGKAFDVFLSEMEERERKERRQLYIRIALGIAFLAILIIALVRRKKSKSKTTS